MNLPQKAMIVAIAAILCAGVVYTVFYDDDGDDGSRFRDWTLFLPDEIEDVSPEDAVASISETADEFLLEASDGNLSVQATRGYVEELNELYDDAYMSKIKLDWAYHRDPGSLSEEYTEWQDSITLCRETMNDTMREILGGPGGDTLRRVIGDETADGLLSGESMSEEERLLLQRENDLMALYNVTDPDDVQAVGSIYLELIDVRNGIADLKGYGSFAEYAYENLYGRDYSPDDLDAVYGMVRDYVVPLYDVVVSLYEGVGYTYSDESELLGDAVEFVAEVSPELLELYTYMVDNGLMDYEGLDTKVDTGFTNYWDAGDGRFVYIFNKNYGNYYDLTTVVHEFGHAASLTLLEKIPEPLDIDVAEICSQGLEALFASGYAPETYGDQATLQFLYGMLGSMIDGCIQDEFQQRAYAGEASTVEELDALFAEIEAEYGRQTVDWNQVIHNFTSPFYYISYGVSAFNALEIFVDAQDDYSAAVDEYLDVIVCPLGYTDLVDSLGMCDFFDADDVAFVTEGVAEWLDGYTSSEPMAVMA